MKKLAISASLLSSILAVDETQPIQQTSEHRHLLYLGPDIFYQKGHTEHVEKRRFKQKNTVHGTLYGLRLGYDYLNPWFIYAGVHGLYAAGKICEKMEAVTRGLWVFNENGNTELRQSHKSTEIFANAEARLGYYLKTKNQEPLSFIPYAGVGWFHIQQDHRRDFSLNWFYGALGFRSGLHFSPLFELGINFKGTRSFYAEARFTHNGSSYGMQESNFWGFEVGVPVTFHFGQERNWDIELEPYLLRWNTEINFYNLGGRLLCGYKF